MRSRSGGGRFLDASAPVQTTAGSARVTRRRQRDVLVSSASRPGSQLHWLLAKEWRELLASRAYWIMLAVMGPLVGLAFGSAVRTYAELSGSNGEVAGVGEAFSPLVGVWAPTFSACELAAVFLLPFVAIRLVSGDRQSGALKLELQHPMPAIVRLGAKAAVLAVGWALATLAPLLAVLLWISYGGALHVPEIGALVAGHFLNAGLSIALAAAMASLTEHPSTAAILTLAVTVGTWLLDFVAAVHGGFWQRLAGYVPAAMVSEFQHGLIALDAVLIALTLAGAGLGVAAIWIRLGVPSRRRIVESAVLIAAGLAAVAVVAQVHATWDVSENRMNSFPSRDEAVLRRIASPLGIEVHLAPEDPRRADLERSVLAKLRRAIPGLRVQYVSRTSTGLFEQSREGYGEIWYELDGHRVMSRSTTSEGVLEAIYELAGVAPDRDVDEEEFRGHPLAVPPRGAWLVFYVLWPAGVLVILTIHRRRSL